ncbi:MAG: hypothetical protein HYS16_00270 [Deltaproteobacteria bacterium]|nr:MAG: hypothetical protein HYS16_00270 [Deltaproteobacteria bacterium]
MISKWKYKKFIFLIILTIYIFFLRVFYIQIIYGDFFLSEMEVLSVKSFYFENERGLILDSYGRVLVDNKLVLDLYIEPYVLENECNDLKIFAKEGLGLNRKEFLRLKKNIETKKVVSYKLSIDKCLKVQEWLLNQKKKTGIRIHHCNLEIDSRYFLKDSTLKKLRDYLGYSQIEFNRFYDIAVAELYVQKEFNYEIPILFIKDLGMKKYEKLEQALYLEQLPGCLIDRRYERQYYYDGNFAHIIGCVNDYIGEEIEQENPEYIIGQGIGIFGIEEQYDEELRGQHDIDFHLMDAELGMVLKDDSLFDFIGEPGNNVFLTIDLDLQKKAEYLLKEKTGCIIAMEVESGFILAMASTPDFKLDELEFVSNDLIKNIYLNAPISPWINRAVQGCYAPGSVFKIVTTMVGLEKRKVSVRDLKRCKGRFKVKGGNWRCYQRKGHGFFSLSDALRSSCDSFFYELGYDIGLQAIFNLADVLFLNNYTGIDLAEEEAGQVPDLEHFYNMGNRYSRGFIINSSIGQGDVQLTPIQIAVLYNAMLNGGAIYRPTLVKEVRDFKGFLIEKNHPFILTFIRDQEYLGNLKKKLMNVFTKGGTASNFLKKRKYKRIRNWLSFISIGVGGKTGTAQVINLAKDVDHLNVRATKYMFRDNALFIGFLPEESPKILVVSIVEHGGFGGIEAAPLSTEILRDWYVKSL